MKLEVIPDRYRKLYGRALKGKSLRASIHAHCMMCVGWEHEAAKDCTDPNCPLLPASARRPDTRHPAQPNDGGANGRTAEGDPLCGLCCRHHVPFGPPRSQMHLVKFSKQWGDRCLEVREE